MTKAIMIQGTSSGVGKTILTLALCRIFKQDGYAVSPLKAQNITTNTYFTKNNEEIAVSQWLQALAAGTQPNPDINPIILKPISEQNATQVIVKGKVFDMITPENSENAKKELLPEIMDSYSRLCGQNDILVIEGAGSPVELNLNKDEMVNMGIAKLAKAPVVLVADIDRGGVFASLYGTLNLLGEAERAYVKATVVNRFKGNTTCFADGVKILEDITKLPVAGVIPYTAINLPQEDDLFECDISFEDTANKTALKFESQYDYIAKTVREALDMKLIYDILNKGV